MYYLSLLHCMTCARMHNGRTFHPDLCIWHWLCSTSRMWISNCIFDTDILNQFAVFLVNKPLKCTNSNYWGAYYPYTYLEYLKGFRSIKPKINRLSKVSASWAKRKRWLMTSPVEEWHVRYWRKIMIWEQQQRESN